MNTALAEQRMTSGLLECGEEAGHPGKSLFGGQQNYWQAISLTEGGNLEWKSFSFQDHTLQGGNVQLGLRAQMPHL